MDKKSFNEKLLGFIVYLKNNSGLASGKELTAKERNILATFRNTAKILNIDSKGIVNSIQMALDSDDAKTQEIFLISGLQKGPISDKDVVPLYHVVRNGIKTSGDDPDAIEANFAKAPEETKQDVENSKPNEDISSIFSDGAEEPVPNEEPKEELPPTDEEPAKTDEPTEPAPDEPKSEEPKEEPTPDEKNKSRITKETDTDQEEEAVIEKAPLFDWYTWEDKHAVYKKHNLSSKKINK